MVVFGPLADVMPVQHLLNAAGLMILILSLAVWNMHYFSVEMAGEA